MPNRKGKHDVAPLIRGAFIRCIARIADGEENEGALATLMEESLKDDFKGTLNVLSKFTVREKEVNKTVTTRTLADLIQHGITEPTTGPDTAVEAEPGSVRH